MASDLSAYHEHFLHWIWQSLQFDLQELATVSGEKVAVIEPGEHNPTDGPDFQNVRLRIDGLQWHGDIEIHWSVSDWNRHGHHTDPNYNQVVLHVVYHEPRDITIERQDQTTPYTLQLKPYLPENLNRLITRFQKEDQLPCSGHVQDISHSVFKKQFEHAHRQYFELKTEQLLRFYNPDLPPATAWKRVLILGLFDGLGISLNREPMVKLGQQLFELRNEFRTSTELLKRALQLGGFDPDKNKMASPGWNLKACRPNNRPELRIKQAAEVMWRILPTSFSYWNDNEPRGIWSQLINSVRTIPGIGKSRSQILFGIVFLPALYLLGNLLHSKKLKQEAFSHWMMHTSDIPDSLSKLYKNSGFPPELYKRRLGAVHQLNHYCKRRRCQDCLVLKEVISS